MERGEDPEHYAAFAPDDAFDSFSYASEHVPHDHAIATILSCLRAIDRSPLEDSSTFFGLINKIDYTYPLDAVSLTGRLKSQYLYRTPFLQRQTKTREWEQLWSAIMRLPMLNASHLEMGLEYRRLAELRRDEDKLVDGAILGPTGDFGETTLAIQWSTTSAYLGYKLLVQTGFRLGRTAEEVIEMKDLNVRKASETRTTTTTFITVYAGVEQ